MFRQEKEKTQMNKVILMGRLVDDPEIYDSADGDAIGLAKYG